jgi:hypothetical protein
MTVIAYDEYVRTMDLDDLNRLEESLCIRRKKLQEEDKKIVWRVFDGWSCYGNYREEDYVKALKCLARHGEETYNSGERGMRDLQLTVEGQKMPLSEYNAWSFDKD